MKHVSNLEARGFNVCVRTFNRWLLSANTLLLLVSCGSGSTAPGVGIQNVSEAAPRLSEFNETGGYAPYYVTGDLQRPRYMFEYSLTRKGNPVIFGGSDERGFSGLDTVEFFDQSRFEPTSPRPPSLTGQWFDTNFEGDPMTLQSGPRMRFTVTLLADGRMLVVGGAPDLTRTSLYDQVEVFDPETRLFETLEDAKMVAPRFRHVAVTLADGNILFIGGQIETTVTIINEDIPEGFPGRQTQATRFVTTKRSEFFSPREVQLFPLFIPETERHSELKTPRGRSGHAVGRLAGSDQTLNNSDDVFLVAGGFQGLSGRFAPEFKFHGTVGRGQADGIVVMEFFDPQTSLFTQVNNVSLGASRINDPYIMNLGEFNDFTPDGVKGMGNLVLVTHGNDDLSHCTVLLDELFLASYTGFGPAQGIQFFAIIDDQNLSHFQGGEYPLIDVIGRAGTNPVALPRGLVTAPNVSDVATWIVSVAGVDIVPVPGGCAQSFGPAVLAGCVFDPFFSLPAAQLGLSPRDLSSQRSQNNPLGVIGCWLNLDSAIPTVDLSAYGTTAPGRWARSKAPGRVYGRNMPVGGEDGILGTPDDRVLLAGGAVEYGTTQSVGGDPTAPSAELLIVPGSTSKTPSP